MTIKPDSENNLLVAGALVMLLVQMPYETLQSVRPITDPAGNATNQIDIHLSFMKSDYRLTIERVPDD